MVLILDGKSDIVVLVQREIGNLICLRPLFSSTALQIQKRPILLHTRANFSGLPSDIDTMIIDTIGRFV